MDELLTLANLGNLAVLIFLQAVLGFDNLLYISIESQRAPLESQKSVRRWGILIAVAARIILLFVMVNLIEALQAPFFSINLPGFIEGEFTFAVLVFLFGGVFIMYTAMKEIGHMMAIEHLGTDIEDKGRKSAAQVVATIVLMNLIFSFDSVLSALAITKVFALLALAIILSGVAMLVLADGVTEFLKKNRMYEVLGLFILLIVGVVLLGEGGHLAQLKLFGYSVDAMSKTTFYFSVVVLVLVELVQSRYQRKLAAERKAVAGNKVAH
ncbi:tellurium resistance protein TerC [Abyssibius alkaniclasticus]|uniref:TerC family protein n=1 Tax=Abyssibius alkaniclasticus TaxID=2881234 RepID=UPI002363E361|nr:tellurium resistance protein TerC [Abyssibius alkaniclasticus]UPH69905.1 tellurium resistance protein TerC [Abyssibius alkaniclasticus]